MTAYEQPLRQHFIAIATDTYDDPTWSSLDGVREEVELIRDWLCDPTLDNRRFIQALPGLASNPTKNSIREGLEHPGQSWSHDDAVFLFVTGHGEDADGSHFLILKGTQRNRLRRTAIRTSDLIGWLADTDVVHLVLVLDACYAGNVMADTLRFDHDIPATWLVLPSAKRDEKALTGALTKAVGAFLAEFARRTGESYGFPGEYLTVDEFLRGVAEQLEQGQSLSPLYGSQLWGVHYCLPNPHHQADRAVPTEDRRRELAISQDDLATHWDPRSRGVRESNQPGWLFAGRIKLMRRVIDAAVTKANVTIVTGGAGSGKSAVLARLVTLSDERFRAAHQEMIREIPPSMLPPAGAVDVAVLATGKLHGAVLTQICTALQVPTGDLNADSTVERWLKAWHDWLTQAEREVTIVIDALDEASNPENLVSEVLARLDPRDGPRRVRLIIGVRSISDDVGAIGDYGYAPLAAMTVQALRGTVVSVDGPEWRSTADVITYVSNILMMEGSPYRTAPPETSLALAQVIGERANFSFLFAGIAASSLVRRGRIVAAEDPEWLRALDDGVLGVFRDDLLQNLADRADREKALTLMRAIAFGHGRGLPWRQIWPTVATALGMTTYRYTDSDVAWLLDSRLSGYLTTDREDGVRVYRLFHDLLRRTLQLEWYRLLDVPTP